MFSGFMTGIAVCNGMSFNGTGMTIRFSHAEFVGVRLHSGGFVCCMIVTCTQLWPSAAVGIYQDMDVVIGGPGGIRTDGLVPMGFQYAGAFEVPTKPHSNLISAVAGTKPLLWILGVILTVSPTCGIALSQMSGLSHGGFGVIQTSGHESGGNGTIRPTEKANPSCPM